MDNKMSNFDQVKHIKIEHDLCTSHNNNHHDNNNEYYIEARQPIKCEAKSEIMCQNKCFDIVDRWIAKVVVRVPTGDNWNNIIQREIALLKVRYPFLPERQLRGKALVKFGIPSSMGDIVRTGTGKVTGVIARELFKKQVKKKRIPASFKVLKKLIPCIKKFEAKLTPTCISVQENQQQSPTLYDRENATITKEKIHQRTDMIKQECTTEEKNYMEPVKRSSIVMNPMHKKFQSSPSNKNMREQISCLEATPKANQLLALKKKNLLSQFNDNYAMMFEENINTTPPQRNFKYEDLSPEVQDTALTADDDMSTSPPRKKFRYDQITPIYENDIPIAMSISSEIIPDVSQKEPRTSLFLMQREELSTNRDSSSKKKPIESSIPWTFWPHKEESNISKRKCRRDLSTDTSFSSSRGFIEDETTTCAANSHRFSADEKSQLCRSQQNFNKSYDESLGTKAYMQKLGKRFSDSCSLEPRPLSRDSSPIEKKQSSLLGATRQSTSQSFFPSPFANIQWAPNTPSTSISSLQISTQDNPWEKVTSQDFSRIEVIDTQKTVLLYTLTPDIEDISIQKDVLTSHFDDDVASPMSIDLLQRGNTQCPSICDSQSDLGFGETLEGNSFDDEELLSDFCSEFDQGWKKSMPKIRPIIVVNSIELATKEILMSELKFKITDIIKFLEP